MLTVTAAFAEAFVNPLAPLLALGAGALLPTRWQARLAAAAAGAALGLPGHLAAGAAEAVLSAVGAALALLLHAEIALHLLLPFLRWVRHCIVTALELAALTRAILVRLVTRRARHRDSGPREDRAP